jgi:hypothetical protein
MKNNFTISLKDVSSQLSSIISTFNDNPLKNVEAAELKAISIYVKISHSFYSFIHTNEIISLSGNEIVGKFAVCV